MPGVVAIDGEIVPVNEARVPVLDRGFLYGDSVYEVVRTYGGVPFALAEHLGRLARSAELVEIPLPMTVEEFGREIEQVLETAGEGEWYLRLILTRGAGPMGLDPALADHPRRLVVVLPLPEVPQHLRAEGAAVSLVLVGRSSAGAMPVGAKTGNYLANIMALRRARQGGAFEAIMVDGSGMIVEGASSNVFLVRDGALLTPPIAAGILDGITRRKVIALARGEGIEVRQEPLRPEDLRASEEAFLTATLKEVLPITRVDDVAIGDGRPGPITARIRQHYLELTRGLTGSRAS